MVRSRTISVLTLLTEYDLSAVISALEKEPLPLSFLYFPVCSNTLSPVRPSVPSTTFCPLYELLSPLPLCPLYPLYPSIPSIPSIPYIPLPLLFPSPPCLSLSTFQNHYR